MPTVDEINAGFDAALPGVQAALLKLPDFLQGVALGQLDTQEVRQDIVNIIRKVLIAAEDARANAGPLKASSPR